MKLKKHKIKHDRLLSVSKVTQEIDDFVEKGWPQEMMISGNMDLGKNGNPVTIVLEDEVTGEQLEISGVKNAFVILEDSRKSSSGWLAIAVGSIEKMGDVLGFLSKTTLETLRRFFRRD